VCNLILVERVTQLAILQLRSNLFRQTLTFEQAHFSADRTSGLMARFTNDIHGIYTGLNMVLGKLIIEPLKMLACLIGAAFICWRLLVLSLLVAPLAVWIVFRLTKSLKKANRRAMEDIAELYGVLSDTFTGIQAVQAFGMEGHERRKFFFTGKQVLRRSMRIALFNALGRVSVETLGIAIICLAMIAGAYLVINQQTSLLGIPMMDRPLSKGSMMAFFAFLAGISDPARKLSEVLHHLQRAGAGADRVYDLLDRQSLIADPPFPKAIASAQPELVFDRVAFHYQAEQPVLREVSLSIPFGETVAIVGPNGCGKTTLTNLLPRFYDPVGGSIRLDGIDLREMRLRDLRSMIGIVAQQAMLFDDTVLANIRYGTPGASDAEVFEAARKAHAHRFIEEKLESGYATVVGERGGRLSGGQRQRVLLARAILRDPKFLILDEATSQIDLESEQLIHKVLEQFRRGRTTLLITHRVSSIALADRVVVMDHGRIVDSGSHAELMKRCEFYSRLRKLGFEQVA
jgi:ATP-binding cassette subfamily B protein/subfamily B ATP-binding cassette protein MsbA